MSDADAPSFKLRVEITDPNLEEAKNRDITIAGKDPAAMLARVEGRLLGKGSDGTASRLSSTTRRSSTVVDSQPPGG
jgi:hypothetical protein